MSWRTVHHNILYLVELNGYPPSGDKGICDEAAKFNSNIKTVAVKEGIGESTISIHPTLAAGRIRETVKASLSGDLTDCLISLPSDFTVTVSYKAHSRAHRNSFYPGAKQVGPDTIQFQTKSYFDVLRFFLFTI
jgi:D-amino peptidase